MNDHTENQDQGQERRGRCGGSRRARLGIAAAVLFGAGALTGALATHAGDAFAHGRGGDGMWSEHGKRHGERGHGGADFMRKRIERMLDAVEATPDQRAAVDAALDELQTTLGPMRERGMEQREKLMTALAAPQVDREAIEALRREHLALSEGRSRAITDAIVEVAEALTPEQRAQALERMRERMERHRR
ncbi:MAG: periplasmic heavy metal sensor [Ectothiorhodospiraceae bacterium]|nr:periplasmic heavy metal sensor [Ectothiorhodospiraceae bacterium]